MNKTGVSGIDSPGNDMIGADNKGTITPHTHSGYKNKKITPINPRSNVRSHLRPALPLIVGMFAAGETSVSEARLFNCLADQHNRRSVCLTGLKEFVRIYHKDGFRLVLKDGLWCVARVAAPGESNGQEGP